MYTYHCYCTSVQYMICRREANQIVDLTHINITYILIVIRIKFSSRWDATLDMNYFFGRHSTHFKYPAQTKPFLFLLVQRGALPKKEHK